LNETISIRLPFSGKRVLARIAADARAAGGNQVRRRTLLRTYPSVANPKRLMRFASLIAEFDLQHVRHLGGGH
jgi:hypothetical protein